MAKESKSDLLEEKQEVIDPPKYSAEEESYIKGLRMRMESARDSRDQSQKEFDGMSYVAQYELNERLANTFIQPKKNKEDTNFQSGTIRQKLFALLSALVNLDLRGDISAFNQEGFVVQALGDAMEDIVLKTDELDNDDEKKYLRHYELLKHGTVFVEEMWDEKSKIVKKGKKFDGNVRGFDYKESVKKAFARPIRNVITGINVYLGDMTKYDISDQPYIFTVDTVPYEEAKRIFGEWERWTNVPRKLSRFEANESNKDWTLLQTKEDYVEILRYQDKWANEFAVVLNGTLMTPVGMPLPWGYEEYNIAQQNLEPIHAKFAYGKSLVARTRNKVALLDEMMRLAILKTQKSFMPPYLNVSGRIISNRVFMPGKISYGIAPNTLIPVNEKETQGVTNAELSMIKEIQESINVETTSPTFSGQREGGDPTATEIIELQRQAKMVLGLTIFSVSILEWKLSWLRLQNLLANWFQPEDQVVDEARGILKDRYRKTTTDHAVGVEGNGKRIVIPTKEVPSGQAIMKAEDQLTKEQGMPVRLIFLNPEEVCSAKYTWQIIVVPKEKKSSEVNKLMFRGFMQDIMPLQPNIEYIRERAASVWGENPKKLFAQDPELMKQQAMEQQMQTEGGGKLVSPRVNLPSPEKAAGQQLNRALKVGV
jgi:hypothetical protein